jgi:hypothetical protein
MALLPHGLHAPRWTLYREITGTSRLARILRMDRRVPEFGGVKVGDRPGRPPVFTGVFAWGEERVHATRSCNSCRSKSCRSSGCRRSAMDRRQSSTRRDDARNRDASTSVISSEGAIIVPPRRFALCAILRVKPAMTRPSLVLEKIERVLRGYGRIVQAGSAPPLRVRPLSRNGAPSGVGRCDPARKVLR